MPAWSSYLRFIRHTFVIAQSGSTAEAQIKKIRWPNHDLVIAKLWVYMI